MKQRELSIAKITRPRITGVYERKRLFKLLDQAGRSLVWISGPAGSGKTTLVASWLDARGLPCLWHQMDEGDADIATFFYYLGLAGRKAAPRVRRPLPLFAPEYLPDIAAFSRRFFEDLSSRVKQPFVFIFDNYQTVGPASMVHGAILAGLSRLPTGVRVVVMSREDPPPAFAGLRANGGMDILGWNDLRLTSAESKGIAQRGAQKGLTPQALDRLHVESDGWAAGLVLLLKSAGVQERPAALPHSHREIFDYFAAEIFDRAPRMTQDFLLATALLPKVAVPVAEVLTGNAGAGALLSELARSNYFTELHPGPVPTYQYHPLFQGYLRARAEKTFSPQQLLIMRRKAGTALEAAGQAEDAADLFHAAGDYGRFAFLLMQRAADMVKQGRHGTLAQRLAGLPQDLREQNPWLSYWYAMSRLPVDPREARGSFEKAYGLFRPGTDDRGLCLSWCGVIYSIYFEFGDYSRMDAWMDELEKSIEQRLPPEPGVIAQAADCALAAFVYRRPSHPAGARWRQRSEKILEALHDGDQKVYLIRRLLHLSLWQGDVSQSLRYAGELIRLARAQGLSPLAQVVAKIWVIYAHSLTAADMQTALRFVPEVLSMVNDMGLKAFASFSYMMGAYAAMISNDLPLAETCLTDIRDHLRLERYLDMSNYYFKLAEFQMAKGLVAEADELMRQAGSAAQSSGVPYALALSHVGSSHLAFEQGRHQEADDHLEKAGEIARGIQSAGLEFNHLLLKAGYALLRNRLQSGIRHLEQALRLGKEKRFMNAEWWAPHLMSLLCAVALERGIEPEYVRELIRRRGLAPPEDREGFGIAVGESWPWPVRIYTLGRFELVLDGKPARFSRKAPRKPLEVLKVLIASGKKEMSAERLSGILWPDAEGDLADQSLATTLKRLRQLIGDKDALQLQEGRVTLDPRSCWVDAWAFERFIQDAEAGREGDGETKPGSPRHPVTGPSRLRSLESAVSLYAGHFLPDDSEQPWAVSLRERLRSKFIRSLERAGLHYEQAGDLKKAAASYEKGIEVDDLAEEFYRRVMMLHERAGRRAEALAVYRRCKKSLESYGVDPSPETEALHDSIRKKP